MDEAQKRQYLQTAQERRSSLDADIRTLLAETGRQLVELQVRMFRWQRDDRGGGFGISCMTAVDESDDWLNAMLGGMRDEITSRFGTRLHDEPEYQPGGQAWKE